jgi:cytochrome c1
MHPAFHSANVHQGTMSTSITLLGVLGVVACYGFVGCRGGQQTKDYAVRAGGNAARGKELIQTYGCGSCHTIPGIYTARGVVGPPLMFFSRRTMIAGELPNSPDNLVLWIRNPKTVEPGTAMPDLGLTDYEAHDVAAYLYTLR